MAAVIKFRLPVLASLLVCSLTCRLIGLAADQCLVCHESMSDKPSTLFKNDIHHQKGITCAGCHGGDASAEEMEKAMNKDAGFIGVPRGNAVSAVCARCHANAETMRHLGSGLPTNQLEGLETSAHGMLSTKGGERIVQCTSCHDAHGIVSVRNPRSPVYPLNVVKTCTRCHADAAFMKTYNPSLPVDQLEKYRTSVHGIRNAGGDPKPAECASCHGSHDILPANDVRSRVYPTNLPVTCGGCHSNAEYMKGYGIPTDQFEKFSRSVHGVALLQKHDLGAPACNKCHGNHGAIPPGIASISKVCGTCHALNADLFSSSPHKKAFDDRKLPECETCHGNHDIVAATSKLLGTAPDAVCTRCHTAELLPKGFRVAAVMRELIDSLEVSEAAAQGKVIEAEQKGMEVSDAKYSLRDVRQARLEARTKVHSFNEAQFKEVVDKGLATASSIREEAQAAVSDYYFRRLGLGVSTLIITVVAVALYLFIRRLEKNPARKESSTQ